MSRGFRDMGLSVKPTRSEGFVLLGGDVKSAAPLPDSGNAPLLETREKWGTPN